MVGERYITARKKLQNTKSNTAHCCLADTLLQRTAVDNIFYKHLAETKIFCPFELSSSKTRGLSFGHNYFIFGLLLVAMDLQDLLRKSVLYIVQA